MCIKNRIILKLLFRKKIESIEKQLDTQNKKNVKENREKLVPIIETIRLCGQHYLALRGSSDSGRIELSTPAENDGNFRILLRFRANGGDQVLKNHLLLSSKNSMYTSPMIQNEILQSFSQLIQRKIVEEVNKNNFFFQH